MIGIIGTGNMGSALINGAVKSFGEENVVFFDTSEDRRKQISNEYGITACKDNVELVKWCDIVVLAVKPQVIFKVIDEIKPYFGKENKTVISIAPGITIAKLKEAFDSKVQIVRVMPNTPAMVGEGMSAVSFPDDFNGDKENTLKLFDSVGRAVVLPESLMNAAVVANGSSPAFVFVFMEALADGAVKFGIPRDKAYEMVAQTVLGSAKLMLETKKHPGELKDAVCSPGGTTICGTAALEEFGLRNAVIKGCEAVYDKTQNFAK
ncbi:MAG: pyrroline-5-carboxylate reductase [Lachnospiraceae bacterium]|nr:pyrroline-5-carboxylate reductase [Lachnospiraceae bacterium]